MSKTKEKILNTSRILFNELGYSNVTIRMIALKLNMSSGNLNYHFKKREDILEALYFEMVVTFDERIANLEQQIPTLNKMQIDIKLSMERMVDYTFFWSDLYNLLSLNEKIKIHFNTVYIQRKNGLDFVFNHFIDIQILKPFEFKKEREFLVERMINFGNTWLYASSIYKKEAFTNKYINKQTNSLMALLYPYLTNKGKKEFQLLVPTFLDK
ncbi:TetR/AcrR family transcriptional regulator [Tenacibaculum retecalamus]|uniref:TetR/AcrR family transcriptional regulator n=1 Tax=Tenacibaculum retecalamus TaxID=3018315 RepID=UPI0023D966C4|nr:TetR/AcrR family transcriptional regulator [Tenacibaculum retecalamus]WBX71074.1 TetR family transcriptional regulator [Tenacibaculum retecalamus]